MKKYLSFLLALTILFTACQKEISWDDNNGSLPGGGGTGGTPTVVKCTGCSYLPVCDSTKLTYVDSSTAGVDTTEATLKILGDTTISGRKFNRISPSAVFSQGLLYNCDGGEYRVYQAVPNLGLNVDSLLQTLGLPAGSITIPSRIQTTILKSAVAAGTTWSDVIFQATPFPLVTITASLNYKIEEKGVQRVVLGKSYNNVIHVSSKLNVAIPLTPLPFDVSIDNYFADGIGIIESKTSNSGVVQNHVKLLAYKIK